MAKKITPDPPFTASAADRDHYLRTTTPPENPACLLETLPVTNALAVYPENPDKPALLAIQPGVTARDALVYVAQLLRSAEFNGDEIGLHSNPLERDLFWGMLNSVEVARTVVEALLAGSSSSANASTA